MLLAGTSKAEIPHSIVGFVNAVVWPRLDSVFLRRSEEILDFAAFRD